MASLLAHFDLSTSLHPLLRWPHLRLRPTTDIELN